MTNNNIDLLIVDDDRDILFQSKVFFEKSGYSVVTADSQQEAQMYLETEKPDVAIFDLMMENDDSGFILSYLLKRKYPEVPVIILTAVASETGVAFSLGSPSEREWIKADAYFEKGTELKAIDTQIRKFLGKTDE
ncbi:MAG: response regulator [Bacteroidales bacterium]|jgi:two-component system alkaline phosphatase synthesis response regulator PhoP|nr:response regulator [Bacteroidales bacterium]